MPGPARGSETPISAGDARRIGARPADPPRHPTGDTRPGAPGRRHPAGDGGRPGAPAPLPAGPAPIATDRCRARITTRSPPSPRATHDQQEGTLGRALCRSTFRTEDLPRHSAPPTRRTQRRPPPPAHRTGTGGGTRATRGRGRAVSAPPERQVIVSERPSMPGSARRSESAIARSSRGARARGWAPEVTARRPGRPPLSARPRPAARPGRHGRRPPPRRAPATRPSRAARRPVHPRPARCRRRARRTPRAPAAPPPRGRP